MDKRTSRYFQSAIASGLACYLAEKLVSGRLSYYINLRFSMLTLAAVIALGAIALVGFSPLIEDDPHPINEKRDTREKTSRKGARVLLCLSPILTAFLGLPDLAIVTMYGMVVLAGFFRLRASDPADPGESGAPSGLSMTTLAVVSVPLLLGVLVPVRPLSTAALSTRGMSLSAPVASGGETVFSQEVDTSGWTILDWIRAFDQDRGLTAYRGKPADVIGFVYHDSRLGEGQFMVSRFVVICCVADAGAIGMAVDWTDSAALPDNAWVNVKGTVETTMIEGHKIPIIRAESVDAVPPPEQPYLYP